MQNPIDYTLDVKNPVQSALQGYQVGQQIRQSRLQESQIASKQQRAQQMNADLSVLSENADATGKDYSQLMTKYPEVSDFLKKIFDVLSVDQQKNQISKVSQVYAALVNEDPETATSLLETQKTAALNAGLQEEADKADLMIKQIEMNPNAAKTSVRLSLSSAMGPSKFAQTFAALGRNKGFSVLNMKEKKELGLDPKKAHQIGPDGKIMAIGGGGVNVSVQAGAPPAGYRNVFNEKDQVISMEAIPGGPAALKIEGIIEAKKKSKQKGMREGEIFIQETEKLKDLVRSAPWYSPVAGVASEKVLPTLRQNRVNAQSIADSLAGRIGFNELQAMRDASATGGALGQVSERELKFLQGAKRSIQLAQSEDQLVKNLNEFTKDFNKIVHGDEYASFRQIPKIIAISERLGSELTDEEIQFMIDEGKI